MAVTRQTSLKIRNIHRYLGLFLGIQFVLWTIGGIYFSFTDSDQISGKHLRNTAYSSKVFDSLIAPLELKPNIEINSIEIIDINNLPFYWVNDEKLYDAKSGELRNNISSDEALAVAKSHMKQDLIVKNINLIKEYHRNAEFVNVPLPAYAIGYEGLEEVKAYVSARDGKFRSIVNSSKRIFEFLFMTHTVGYEDSHDINNVFLRIASLIGLITVLSGFLLWYVSSATITKFMNRFKKKN